MAAQPRQQLPPNAEELDFRVIEERWNDYELQGGITLLARSILIKVLRVRGPNPGQTQIGTAGQDIFVSRAPGERGQPSPLTPEEVSGQVQVERRPLRVERANELWNVYEVPQTGDRIRTRLMIRDAFLVPDRFDNFGYPALIIQSGVMTEIERQNVGRV